LLRGQTLAVTPGWSEAYALFTKGEAPMVVSYTTSEFYHRVVEKSNRYKAANFSEHGANVEFGGILKGSKNKQLAASFLDFLLTPAAQKVVAEANWMYPIIPESEIKDLNPIFSSTKKPSHGEIRFLTPKERGDLKETWLREFK
jgi:thiamine transport system substrate-binding protein